MWPTTDHLTPPHCTVLLYGVNRPIRLQPESAANSTHVHALSVVSATPCPGRGKAADKRTVYTWQGKKTRALALIGLKTTPLLHYARRPEVSTCLYGLCYATGKYHPAYGSIRLWWNFPSEVSLPRTPLSSQLLFHVLSSIAINLYFTQGGTLYIKPCCSIVWDLLPNTGSFMVYPGPQHERMYNNPQAFSYWFLIWWVRSMSTFLLWL